MNAPKRDEDALDWVDSTMKSAASRVVPARARDGRLVAIRTWRSDARSMHDALQLAKLAMRVEHPLFAAILKCELEPESALTIVSEYVPGKTLDVWIGEHGLPAIGVAIDLVERLCRALHLLHLEGIAHHSLYPGNFIVDEPDGASEAQIEAKLLDKGVAGIMRPWPPRLEAAHFMAPEALAAGRPFAATIEAEARMNVYSCGCLLHYLCTGQPPFQSVSSERLMSLHGLGQPAEPGQLNSSVPAALEQAIVRALAIEPQGRFTSCHELADVLALVEAPLRSSGVRRRVSVRPPPPPPARAAEVAPPPVPVSEAAPQRASVPPKPPAGPIDWRSLVPPLVSGGPIDRHARLLSEPHRLVPPLSAAQIIARRRVVSPTQADITLPAVAVPSKPDLRRRSLELPVARDGAVSARASEPPAPAIAPQADEQDVWLSIEPAELQEAEPAELQVDEPLATPVCEPNTPPTEESIAQPDAGEPALSEIESPEVQAAEPLVLPAEAPAASLGAEQRAEPVAPRIDDEAATATVEPPASEADESVAQLADSEREQPNIAPCEVHSAEPVAVQADEQAAGPRRRALELPAAREGATEPSSVLEAPNAPREPAQALRAYATVEPWPTAPRRRRTESAPEVAPKSALTRFAKTLRSAVAARASKPLAAIAQQADEQASSLPVEPAEVQAVEPAVLHVDEPLAAPACEPLTPRTEEAIPQLAAAERAQPWPTAPRRRRTRKAATDLQSPTAVRSDPVGPSLAKATAPVAPASSGIESTEVQAAEPLDLHAEALAVSPGAEQRAEPVTAHVDDEPAPATDESPASEAPESAALRADTECEQANVASSEVHSAEPVAVQADEQAAQPTVEPSDSLAFEPAAPLQGDQAPAELSDEPDALHAVEAVVEDAVEAVVEDAVEAVVEGSVEAVAEGSVEAVAEGSVEAVAEGSVEAVAEGSVEPTDQQEDEPVVQADDAPHAPLIDDAAELAVASAELPATEPVPASAEETSPESQPAASPSEDVAAASSEEARDVLVPPPTGEGAALESAEPAVVLAASASDDVVAMPEPPPAVLVDTVPELAASGERDSTGEALALRASDAVISTFLRRADPPRVVCDVRVERARLPISRVLGRRVIDATSSLEPDAPRGRWLLAMVAAALLGIGYALTSWLGSSSTEQGVRAVSLARESAPGAPTPVAPLPPSAAGGVPPVASPVTVPTPLPPLPAELQSLESELAHTRASAEGSPVTAHSAPERPVSAMPNARDERPGSMTLVVASEREAKALRAAAPARDVTTQGAVPVASAARRGPSNETQIAIEQLTVRGSIPPTRVLRAVERIRPHFTECYDAHGSRARLPPVRVDALVDEAGRVRESSIDSGGTRALEACLGRATRKLTVRALDSAISASWKLRITPGAPLPRYRGF